MDCNYWSDDPFGDCWNNVSKKGDNAKFRRDFDEVMEKIEFGTLMFFAGLFVLMKALEELGLINFIADKVSDLIKQVPSGDARLTVAILLLLWVSALVSAFMDNIPFTGMFLYSLPI